MVTVPPNPLYDELLPEKYPEEDLFVCDVADAVLKDILPQLEHPFYSLSKKPDVAIRRYERNGHWLEITPSVKGLATIYDKDILIYAISQIMTKLNRGQKVSKRIRLDSFDFLRFTNRGTGGKDYDALVEGLKRLSGTRIATNIRTGNEEQTSLFGLIDEAHIGRQLINGKPEGRILYIELTLSDWVFNAIRHNEVLTLSRDYFRLRKPMERRVYELARKHCGNQKSWRCGVDVLYAKSGSKSPMKQFRYLLKQIGETDHLPDYHLALDGDMVVFTSRGTVPQPAIIEAVSIGTLDSDIYELARQAAPGWDVRMIEQEWRNWCTQEEIEPKAPGRHFLKFCVTWYEKRGRA